MPKQEEKYCPKCNASFECRAGDVVNCQCGAVQLGAETIAFLSQTYFDCLCKNCLSKIDIEVNLSTKYAFPTHKAMFIEGLHYYIENGNWVFTEMYHMLRGNCCGNGCRHCVYGFGK